jgi:hypothetical protein
MTDIPDHVREYIRERDGDWCRACNNDYNIDIHHIDSNRYNNVPNNLVQLCRDCHILIHSGRLRVKCINGDFFFGGEGRFG